MKKFESEGMSGTHALHKDAADRRHEGYGQDGCMRGRSVANLRSWEELN